MTSSYSVTLSNTKLERDNIFGSEKYLRFQANYLLVAVSSKNQNTVKLFSQCHQISDQSSSKYGFQALFLLHEQSRFRLH